MRPRPDAHRRGSRPAAAHAGRARRRPRRGAARDRRDRADVPLGAPLPRRGGALRSRRLLPGRGRRRSCDRATSCATSRFRSTMRARRSPPSRRKASGSTATSDDELYVAAETPESKRYAVFQRLPVHVVGPLLDWLAEQPTKLVTIGDPEKLDALEVRLRARFDGPALHREVAPLLPGDRGPRRDQGRRDGVRRAAARLHRGRDDRVRRRGERRGAPRMGRPCCRGRERPSARPGRRRRGLPLGRGRGSRAEDREPF